MNTEKKTEGVGRLRHRVPMENGLHRFTLVSAWKEIVHFVTDPSTMKWRGEIEDWTVVNQRVRWIRTKSGELKNLIKKESHRADTRLFASFDEDRRPRRTRTLLTHPLDCSIVVQLDGSAFNLGKSSVIQVVGLHPRAGKVS